MKINVNGQAHEMHAKMTIAALLEQLGILEVGVAVACNELVVRRGQFAEHMLADGDRIEIVRAVAGG